MTRRPLSLLCAGALTVAVHPTSGAQPTARQLIVTAHIVAVETSPETALEVRSDRSALDPDNGVLLFEGVPELRLGDGTLGVDDDSMAITWNGEADIPADAPVEMISSPRITIREGGSGTIRSLNVVEYMQPSGDGSCYELRRTDPSQSPRVIVRVTVRPGPSIGLLEVETDFEMAVLTGREPLAGTDLDIGRPIVATKAFRTREPRPIGEWWILSSSVARPDDASGERQLLVFLRLDEPPTR